MNIEHTSCIRLVVDVSSTPFLMCRLDKQDDLCSSKKSWMQLNCFKTAQQQPVE